MADPISVISLVEGSIGLVLQCGSVAKLLSDMMTKFKHAEVAITSMIQEIETIQFAWNRIKEWSEEHAEAATDSSFVQRLEKSLQCGTLVLSALEQDLANYKHTADNASFMMRSRMAWNERAFLDHQHRVRGQVHAMTLMLQVSQLPTPKARTKLLNEEEKALSASDESAYSIVPSRMSSRMSVSTRSRDSISSIESKELVYYPLSFEDELFTARVYKRNYRSPWVNNLSKLHQGKMTEQRRVPGAELKIPEKGPLRPSSSTGIIKTTISAQFSQPLPLIQEVSLRDLRPVPPGPALATESDPIDRSVTILDSIPPTSGGSLSIGSGLQYWATDPSINKLYPAGHADVLGAIDPASRHITQIDKSKVAVARPPPASEAQNKLNSSLLLAVEKGNLDDVKTLIHRGAQVNPQHLGVVRELPLHIAIRSGDFSMTELLLQQGANCTQAWLGTPPIHIACKFGGFKIMKLLLDAGASASSLDALQAQPLHRLLSGQYRTLDTFDLIELLISRGADVNARTGSNETPLHLSCKDPNVDNVRSLLVHGADPDSICGGGRTAMHVLTAFPSHIINVTFLAIFRLLHDYGADVNAKDEFGDTTLHLLAKRSVVSPFALGYANVHFFELLMIHGANMNAQNNVGKTPLHVLATVWTELAFFKAILQLSLQHGVNVDAQNEDGDTPLHTLIKQAVHIRVSGTACEAIIQLLLQHGANVNTRNSTGDTPLHTLVTEIHDGCQTIVQLLIEHGVNVDAQNCTGDTPLHVVGKVGLKHWPLWTVPILQSLIDNGAELGIQNIAGDTPLVILARHGHSVENNAVVEKIN